MSAHEWSEDLAAEAAKFLRFVKKRMRDPDVVEDLLQDAFVKALQSKPRDEEKAHAWFYQILRNVIVDAGRKEGRRRDGLARLQNESLSIELDQVIQDVACDCLKFFQKRLKNEDAEIIQKTDLDEVPLKVYAKEKSITLGAAKLRRHRARKALKEEILKVCRCFVDELDCACPKSG